MTNEELLNVAHCRTMELLEAAGDDVYRLPLPVATFFRVFSAQEIIDNGGYYLFFERDWEGQPPYSEFIEAYCRIGCQSQASELARVVSTFPFPAPHANCQARNQFMEKHYDGALHGLAKWGDELCGNKAVWERLAQYYTTHERSFS